MLSNWRLLPAGCRWKLYTYEDVAYTLCHEGLLLPLIDLVKCLPTTLQGFPLAFLSLCLVVRSATSLIPVYLYWAQGWGAMM